MGERGWEGTEAAPGCTPPAPGHWMASPLWVSVGLALGGQEGILSSMSQATGPVSAVTGPGWHVNDQSSDGGSSVR